MGQYSWIYSDKIKQVVNNKVADTYLLVPAPFQETYGKSIYEHCYDGYGHFGKYDVYELVAEWNREYISEDMLREKDRPSLNKYMGLYEYEKENLLKEGFSEEEVNKIDSEKKQAHYERGVRVYNYTVCMLNDYRNGMSDEDMERKYFSDWKRDIGIAIACYDEQNKKLPYPIKIVSKEMEYEKAKFSKRDPKQGCQG